MYYCVCFCCCRSRWPSPPAWKVRGDEAAPDPPAAWSFLRRRVVSRAASGVARGEDAPPVFNCSETFLGTVFVVRENSPAIPGVLGGYFANFKLFHVTFFLFSFEFLLFVVLM
ncbi:hypothetical protein Peur_024730 [Populus x canadensis]